MREAVPEAFDFSVRRSEVVPPFRNAMRLIDGNRFDVQVGQTFSDPGVFQTFWRCKEETGLRAFCIVEDIV